MRSDHQNTVHEVKENRPQLRKWLTQAHEMHMPINKFPREKKKRKWNEGEYIDTKVEKCCVLNIKPQIPIPFV